MKKCFAFILVGVLLAGCTSSIKPTVRQIDTITRGVAQTKKTGEPMLEKGVIKVMPGFTAKATFYPPKLDSIIFPVVRRGDIWECKRKLDNGDLLCTMPVMKMHHLILDSGQPVTTDPPFFIMKADGELAGVYYDGSKRIVMHDHPVIGMFEPVEVPMKDSYKREVVYDGRTDDIIRLTYLEFADDFSKPMLFQGLTYNISSLNIINVRDILIEVLDANEQEIRFMIMN